MEGDLPRNDTGVNPYEFLSTPSGWRATATLEEGKKMNKISIHALRVEGDYHYGDII